MHKYIYICIVLRIRIYSFYILYIIYTYITVRKIHSTINENPIMPKYKRKKGLKQVYTLETVQPIPTGIN